MNICAKGGVMSGKKYFLGIDIGSVSIAMALLDEEFGVFHTDYAFHKGQVAETLLKLLAKIEISEVSIGYTSCTPTILKQGMVTDSRIAYITAAKHFHPDLRALLIIGAEKFGLATFSNAGEYQNYKFNTSCAAGTGNFLDQQAERLNLKSIQEFSDRAYSNRDSFPLIASRCAVFAKTDLIHAQQEGYTLTEICDGLSFGLAKNIIDAVSLDNTFNSVVAAGGVALNKAVIRHIERITGIQVIVDQYAPVYGAIGAAINCRDAQKPVTVNLRYPDDLILSSKNQQKYLYPPLQLKLTDYPDFGMVEHYEYHSACFPYLKPVETDLYSMPEHTISTTIFLGIDIGSTSTKAVLLNTEKDIIAGFYTQTSGQPLMAVQVIFETIRDLEVKRGLNFIIKGAGTTGSGRKFTGKIMGADIILDEITAHARAAYELDPETDTIIEIGGQDSKFTVMQDGTVTFAVMNNVCAAGTGSFIEEQAKKLGCSLPEYSSRAEMVNAPMASDRCTVFMERDLNHYLNEGYTVDEILAAVLHATRDNYLTKVAIIGKIGKKIFFQGATAKNKALVAAFEQKLNKPIRVSKFCHLTGAIGVALELHNMEISCSSFRGLDLYKKSIPVRSEICQLCTNHCKLKVAEIDEEIVAYGFLCGRDYHVKRYIKNKISDFQLISKRKEVFESPAKANKSDFTIGIPAGLHLYEEIPFWRKFFELMHINTITSEDYQNVIKDGKNFCSTEFCTPIAAMHAHVDYLKKKTDFVFLPTYLEESIENKISKQYCYYTQFVSSVISLQKKLQPTEKILTPLLKSSRGELFTQLELYKMLKSIGLQDIGFLQVTRAYEKAKKHIRELTKKWQQIYLDEITGDGGIHVMLLGRPYTVLSAAMNNHIPEIIEKAGVKTFYMDMISYKYTSGSMEEELIKTIKWKFASRILNAAEVVAKTDSCYPVLITSFKCTPDSFAIEYFKEIFQAAKKPYLILQLDEHDSTVGYETRIEAGIRTFRNHYNKQRTNASFIPASLTQTREHRKLSVNGVPVNSWENHIRGLIIDAVEILRSHGIDFRKSGKIFQRINTTGNDTDYDRIIGSEKLKNKTLLLPSWDQQVGPLLEAVLQNSGLDAHLVTSSNESIQRSLSYNTGQCLPLNIVVQDAIDYIITNRLDPSNTVLWIIKSSLSCNLSMFPQYMRKLLNNYGKGMELVSVYPSDIIFYDISLQTAVNAYLAYMFGGYIRKIGCKIRPYEKREGNTDQVIKESFILLYDVFKQGKPEEIIIKEIIRKFECIETAKKKRTRVCIFGDLYVRDNDLMNQGLIKMIEENGGEVITTPYSEYLKIVINPYIERAFKEGRYLDYARMKFLKSLIPLVEENYAPSFNRLLGAPYKESKAELESWLNKFGLNLFHRGESLENILKIHRLIHQYPDIDLFIQTNPAYCCPSLVTEAMTPKIEELTGIPVVTIEYDGTSGFKNEDIIPYLKYGKIKHPV
jgi:predicted CoA-substrate-specific enzyme activase